MSTERFQRRLTTNNGWTLNVSKTGLSQSQRVGKFTFNSRGIITFNSSIKGLSFRMPTMVGLIFIPVYWVSKLCLLPLKFTWWVIKSPFKLIRWGYRKIKNK